MTYFPESYTSTGSLPLVELEIRENKATDILGFSSYNLMMIPVIPLSIGIGLLTYRFINVIEKAYSKNKNENKEQKYVEDTNCEFLYKQEI